MFNMWILSVCLLDYVVRRFLNDDDASNKLERRMRTANTRVGWGRRQTPSPAAGEELSSAS